MKLVLDTSVLIADDAPPPGDEVSVASVSLAELAFGIAAATSPADEALRRTRLARVSREFGPGLPFDDAAASAFGVLCGLDLAAGRNPRARALDLMIAATAYANDAGVLTRNPDDFASAGPLVRIVAL